MRQSIIPPARVPTLPLGGYDRSFSNIGLAKDVPVALLLKTHCFVGILLRIES